MVADRITVGVFALDQLILPKPAAAKGWTQRLAETVPLLADGAAPTHITLDDTRSGPTLAEDARLGAATYRAGTSATLEPVAERPGLFLLRLGGKAAAVASASDWHPGTGHPDDALTDPDGLSGYVAGTLIDTPDGPCPVETLVAGDAVTTLGNGSRPLRWVGRRRVAAVELLAHPGSRPVSFAPGVLGNHRGLTVSPRQRILVDDWRAAVYFGEDRVLVAAQALVDDRSARVTLPPDGIDYVMLLCDRHEVLLAEGGLSESFHPGDAGLAALPRALRVELAAICPEAELARRRAAFPIVRNAEARALRLQT